MNRVTSKTDNAPSPESNEAVAHSGQSLESCNLSVQLKGTMGFPVTIERESEVRERIREAQENYLKYILSWRKLLVSVFSMAARSTLLS